MPRKIRVEYGGAIYHVMSRGDRREDIYLDDVDRQDYLKTLAEACQKTGFQVHTYCLMRNHFHLVIETPNGWCKSVSVNCLSSLRLAPSGVRRSEGERSEPSAAEPRRGQGAPRAKSWSRAGHIGFLLGCRKHNQQP